MFKFKKTKISEALESENVIDIDDGEFGVDKKKFSLILFFKNLFNKQIILTKNNLGQKKTLTKTYFKNNLQKFLFSGIVVLFLIILIWGLYIIYFPYATANVNNEVNSNISNFYDYSSGALTLTVLGGVFIFFFLLFIVLTISFGIYYYRSKRILELKKVTKILYLSGFIFIILGFLLFFIALVWVPSYSSYAQLHTLRQAFDTAYGAQTDANKQILLDLMNNYNIADLNLTNIIAKTNDLLQEPQFNIDNFGNSSLLFNGSYGSVNTLSTGGIAYTSFIGIFFISATLILISGYITKFNFETIKSPEEIFVRKEKAPKKLKRESYHDFLKKLKEQGLDTNKLRFTTVVEKHEGKTKKSDIKLFNFKKKKEILAVPDQELTDIVKDIEIK